MPIEYTVPYIGLRKMVASELGRTLTIQAQSWVHGARPEVLLKSFWNAIHEAMESPEWQACIVGFDSRLVDLTLPRAVCSIVFTFGRIKSCQVCLGEYMSLRTCSRWSLECGG